MSHVMFSAGMQSLISYTYYAMPAIQKSLAATDSDCRQTCSDVIISSVVFSCSVVRTQWNR